MWHKQTKVLSNQFFFNLVRHLGWQHIDLYLSNLLQVGNCDIRAEQKILFMNEIKRNEI
jgi:hypothetical protein